MADERVRLTLPKRLRPVLDKLATPLGMGHTEFVTWLIDSYNARDLGFLPLVTGAQSGAPSTQEAEKRPIKPAQSAQIEAPPTVVVPIDGGSLDNDDFDDAF